PVQPNWEQLLKDPDALVRTETIRWWRSFKGQQEIVDLLLRRSSELLKEDLYLKGDLASVLRHLEVAPEIHKKLELVEPELDKNALTEQTIAFLDKLPAADRQKRAFLGRQVFDRSACTKCHTTVTQDTPLAPSLKGIATAQKIDYLIESVLYPS